MIDSGGNKILFPPFGGLSGEVPPVLPFLCLHFERIFVVYVDGGGISDGIGSDTDGDHCVGDSGRHHLSYVRDKAPEHIVSDGQIRCVFVSVEFISSCPRCHRLLVRNTAGSDKLG